MSDRRGIFGRLVAAGHGMANNFTEELMSNPKFGMMLGSAVARIQNSKENLDRNLQFVFNSLNVPTRRDYSSLLGKIDKMNQAVSDLEMRIDDLIAASERLASSGERTAAKK